MKIVSLTREMDMNLPWQKTRIEHHNDSDVAALEQGKISITELDIRILGQKLNT